MGLIVEHSARYRLKRQDQPSAKVRKTSGTKDYKTTSRTKQQDHVGLRSLWPYEQNGLQNGYLDVTLQARAWVRQCLDYCHSGLSNSAQNSTHYSQRLSAYPELSIVNTFSIRIPK